MGILINVLRSISRRPDEAEHASAMEVTAPAASPTGQTPVHSIHNPDLLELMPPTARRVVEIGCSSGALARAYRQRNPNVHYIGIDVVPEYIELAREHCDEVLSLDIESLDAQALRTRLGGDCWVFGDVLEHLRDPWSVLKRVQEILPAGGCIVTCIPNAQHWSVQARLATGQFRYEESGLLDRTHIRWFTRTTMMEMFQNAGLIVDAAKSRIFIEPLRDTFLAAVRQMAEAAGVDPEQAATDATPFQYVFRCMKL